MPEISVIVPVYNEAENVIPLAREISGAIETTGRDYEIVFVDDGSSDATWERINEARRGNRNIRGLRHERNAGQSAAVWTGISATTSPVIATLDGDLQNDPAELPRMLALLNQNDLVCGMRTNRRDTWVRRVSSAVARWARKTVLGVDFRDTGCALRVFRRQALEGVFGFDGLHRFLPIIVGGMGFRVVEIPVNHRPRVAGLSKYGIWGRLWRGIFDLAAMAWYRKRQLRPVRYSQTPLTDPDHGSAGSRPSNSGPVEKGAA